VAAGVTDVVGLERRLPASAATEARAEVVPLPLTRAGALLVAASAALWTALVGWLAVWRHQEFLSHRYDLGNMTQAVWSSAQGRLLEMTDGATNEQVSRLAGHVDPILILFAPLWWVYSAPEALILGQAAALAAGLYPVVRLALKHTGSRLIAALLGGWYLVFPWVIWNALNDMHPVTLVIPLLLYAIWFLDEHHLGRFAIVAALALLCGELVGLTVAAIGIWYALAHGRRRIGAAIALAGAAWTAMCLLVVIPHFNDGRSSRFYSHFESVGGSPAGLAKTLVTDPGAVLAAITTVDDFVYVLLLLLPTAFLALGQPLMLLIALPQLGVNMLSEQSSSTGPTFQYVAPILPALVAGTVLAVARFKPRLRVFASALLFAGTAICLISIPPKPGGQYFVFGPTETRARVEAMRAALDLVPDDAGVTTTNGLGAHLSARRFVHVFPARVNASWAVLDLRDPWLVRGTRIDEPRFRALVARFERDARWRLVFDREDVRVYRKR